MSWHGYDHDALPNEYEQANGINPLDRSDSAADPDGDGLQILDEYHFIPQSYR